MPKACTKINSILNNGLAVNTNFTSDPPAMTGYSVLCLLLLFHGLTAHPTAETFREFSVEDEEILFHILNFKASEIKSILETGRKLLQTTRKWQVSHPAESRLLRCVVRYCIDTKIPGLVTTADEDDDSRRGLSSPIWIQESSVSFSDISQDVTQILANDVEELYKSNAVNYEKLEFKKKALKALYTAYIYLRDILSQYKLLGCSLQYLISKFWEWVDSAP